MPTAECSLRLVGYYSTVTLPGTFLAVIAIGPNIVCFGLP